jgi:hypothetical protein
MKVNVPFILSLFTFIIALVKHLPDWWWVPLTVLFASLVYGWSRDWVLSERLGSAQTLSIVLKSVCSLFILYAFAGTVICGILLFRWFR